jgi:hypothetical protein
VVAVAVGVLVVMERTETVRLSRVATVVQERPPLSRVPLSLMLVVVVLALSAEELLGRVDLVAARMV